MSLDSVASDIPLSQDKEILGQKPITGQRDSPAATSMASS